MVDDILELHIPWKLLAQDVSRHLLCILRAVLECRPKMASIQKTPAWTGSCYCPLPTFGPSWLPYIGNFWNFSVFARGITWPIFARWGEPRFLLEHAFDLSVHDCSRWSCFNFMISNQNWYCPLPNVWFHPEAPASASSKIWMEQLTGETNLPELWMDNYQGNALLSRLWSPVL